MIAFCDPVDSVKAIKHKLDLISQSGFKLFSSTQLEWNLMNFSRHSRAFIDFLIVLIE